MASATGSREVPASELELQAGASPSQDLRAFGPVSCGGGACWLEPIMNPLSPSQLVLLPLSEDRPPGGVANSSHFRCKSATTSFPEPFSSLAVFFRWLAQQAFNGTGDGAVTRLCDMPPAKKSLPALVCPYTLPNKVVAQRQLSREP